jgi:hypothetical protein
MRRLKKSIERRLLNLPAASIYLGGLSIRALYGLITAGRLRPVRLPGCRRTFLDVRDLGALVKSAKAKTTQTSPRRPDRDTDRGQP